MPFDHDDEDAALDPDVAAELDLLYGRHPGLTADLANDPHLAAALVSRRLSAAQRNNAIVLIEHRMDIPAAKSLLRLQPYMEAVNLRAIGLEFEGFNCTADFNRGIASFMPNSWRDQRRMLTVLALTVPRAGEAGGMWFAQLLRKQSYELRPDSVALLCAFIWFSQNIKCPAGDLIYRAWHQQAPLGEVAAEAQTFARWLRLGLLARPPGVPAWLPDCQYGGLDLIGLGSAQQARNVASVFGDHLFASFAEKLHGETASVFVARRSKDGELVGYIEFAAAPGQDYHYPAAIKGRPELTRLTAKLPAAAYHLLEIAHRPTGGLQSRPVSLIPAVATLGRRWSTFIGPYVNATGAGPLFPQQPTPNTIHALKTAIDELDSVATKSR